MGEGIVRKIIIFLILLLLLSTSMSSMVRAEPEKVLEATAEYNVNISSKYIVFPIAKGVVNCTCGEDCYLIAVVESNDIKIRLDLIEYYNNTKSVSIKITLDAEIYKIKNDDNNIEYICKELIVIDRFYVLDNYGYSINPPHYPLYLLISNSIGNISISYLSFQEMMFAPYLNETEAEALVQILNDALAKANFNDVIEASLAKSRSGDNYYVSIVPVNTNNSNSNNIVNGSARGIVFYSGEALFVLPPPGEDYTLGDVEFSSTETGLSGSFSGSFVDVSDGFVYIIYNNYLYRIESIDDKIYVFSFINHPGARGLYHWTSGLVLEARVDYLLPSQIAFMIGIDEILDYNYPVYVNDAPIIAIVNAGSPEEAAMMLSPAATPEAISLLGLQTSSLSVKATSLNYTIVGSRAMQDEIIDGDGGESIWTYPILAMIVILALLVLYVRRSGRPF